MATRSLAPQDEASGVLQMTAETQGPRPAPPEMRPSEDYDTTYYVLFERITKRYDLNKRL